jgi:hypothetical protein
MVPPNDNAAMQMMDDNTDDDVATKATGDDADDGR